jgi:hypothetical protein
MLSTSWRRALMPVVAAAVLVAGAVVYTVVRSGPDVAGPTFYGDINYRGPGVTLGVGNYDLPQLRVAGLANDRVSSMQVPAGWTVVAFQHSGFVGAQWTFAADSPDLVDADHGDAISSMRITRTP